MKLKGRPLLKISGIINILLGLILLLVGFYIMANGMSVENMSSDMSQEQLNTLKYLGAGGMYIIVIGVVDCIAGFVGFLNADNLEYAKKCCMYGAILIGFSILDLIIMLVISTKVTTFNLWVILIPFILAGVYMTGAVLNVRTPSIDTDSK